MRSFSSLVSGLALVAVSALACVPAEAQQTYFNSRLLFEAANAGLATETLENGNVDTGESGPLDSTTNNAAFQPGDILDGIRFQAVGTSGVPGSGGNQYYYNNVYGPPGNSVWTTNIGLDSLDITFYNGGVTAVGFDYSVNSADGDYTITLFDLGGSIIDTQVAPSSSFADFFGVTSVQTIGRININAPSYETVDNVSFLPAGISATAPEPGSLALLGLALPLGIGIIRRRKV